MMNKIAIIHYRVGRTDGVSLEIEKRKEILESLNYQVKLISGPVQQGADFIIDELEFDSDEVKKIKENSFKYFNNGSEPNKSLMKDIDDLSHRIEEKFLEYNSTEHFSAVLLHNIFSHGRHIAAASAFTRVAQKLQIPFICTNHDYYWEREEYKMPVSQQIKDYLNEFVPPSAANIQQISINSLAQEKLKERSKIDSTVFPDIFDFSQPKWKRDSYNQDFRKNFDIKENDIVVLQATRIVARKGIEIAVDFVKELENKKEQLIGKKLYNGRKIDKSSEIIFVLAGYAEESANDYLKNLKEYILKSGIKARFIHKKIASDRSTGNAGKIYSLWDSYVHADIVTYPSLIEGWGNQFIEAVFARRPVVLFEYPVFKADIKHEGYAYVSLGDKYDIMENGLAKIDNEQLTKSVNEVISVLTDTSNTPFLLENNSAIGEQYHGYNVLKNFLEQSVKKNLEESKTF